jgi:hypothetical protein
MDGVAPRVPFGCFVDRTREPGSARVRTALASARTAWDNLEAHLAGVYGLRGSFRFMYGKRYGWALRFEQGGRFVLAMYPNRGHLTVQIILTRAQVAVASAMNLPSAVARVLEAATDYPEGRWLFIPVTTRKSALELKTLIGLKLSRPARRRSLGDTGAAGVAPSNKRLHPMAARTKVRGRG